MLEVKFWWRNIYGNDLAKVITSESVDQAWKDFFASFSEVTGIRAVEIGRIKNLKTGENQL